MKLSFAPVVVPFKGLVNVARSIAFSHTSPGINFAKLAFEL